MASTSGLITATNITLTRAAAAPVSLLTVSHLLGTLVYDLQDGSYDGADWSFTGDSTSTGLDISSVSITKLYDAIATVVQANTGTSFVVALPITNYAVDYAFDCLSTSRKELARVFAAMAYAYGASNGLGGYVVARQATSDFAAAKQVGRLVVQRQTVASQAAVLAGV